MRRPGVARRAALRLRRRRSPGGCRGCLLFACPVYGGYVDGREVWLVVYYVFILFTFYVLGGPVRRDIISDRGRGRAGLRREREAFGGWLENNVGPVGGEGVSFFF